MGGIGVRCTVRSKFTAGTYCPYILPVQALPGSTRPISEPCVAAFQRGAYVVGNHLNREIGVSDRTISRRLAAAFGGACTIAALFVCATATRAQGVDGAHGVNLADRDTTCAPCRDFYRYANGAWLDRTTIPAEWPIWDGFLEIIERTATVVHGLLDSLVTADTRPGTPAWKVGHYYASCMDSARIERDGATPLRAELGRIDAIASTTGLQAEIARLQREGIGVGFNFTSGQDPKHSTDVIADLSQGGIGLPDRDYYFRADTVAQRTRRQYVAHVARLLALTGVPNAAATGQAKRIMAIETQLAKASMTIVERRDPNAIYHKMTASELAAATPAWSWPAFFTAVDAPPIAVANVEEPAFFTAMNGMLRTVPLADWRAYLRWQYAAAAAHSLSRAFVREEFRFDSTLTGATVLHPRWKRCAASTDGALGEALGQVYAERAFPPEAKAKGLQLVANLEGVLHDDLSTLAWMDTATRRQAIVKLAAFANKIAYPDRWRDYSALPVTAGPYWSNREAANTFEVHRQLLKIGNPVDRNEWGMSPATVNAYYNPRMNEIVFPAAILQAPFFDPAADAASNYGAMGAVIGHEMTHGFDDEGRQYDADGNLRDWWTPADAAAYKARAARIVTQYGAYVALDTIHINGEQTLGENIADIGGLRIAYRALERSLEGQPRPLIGGLTPEQRFFVAFAQAWQAKTRPEYLRTLVQTDVHSPDEWRALGAVVNMPEFAQAFGCHAGDPMVRPDSLRGEIW